MKLKVGDLVEMTREVKTFMSGEVFPVGTKMAVLRKGGSTYKLGTWPVVDGKMRHANWTRAAEKDLMRGQSNLPPFNVVGTAFEAPKLMRDWVGRTVVIQQTLQTRGARPAPRQPLVPVIVAEPGDRMLVLNAYHGLSLGYPKDSPRYKDDRYVISGVYPHYTTMILEPLCPKT